ncbi:hypothetical protein BDY19DRAFT_234587 [Irpex rosettiformis]|uniref:Uncharacterized protein n=1 Tax=Irpex rosettiformis TaxID=378272 RepID=A0ACB8TZW1_9APHY|nr:hypothetical protein BDY19DRAFT_234587 [Irpex rosettiformis]
MASSGANYSTLDPSNIPASTVVSGLSTNSSWNEISKTIRAVDGERVKDCKEDIDTILVFAGLFSAVMTAFLVESYQTLQQDPQDTIVSLLQQLVTQTSSFVVNDNFVNSTNLQPNSIRLSTFEPPMNAQRVNVLWFSSLTLSLVSASFSHMRKRSSVRMTRLKQMSSRRVFGYSTL